MPHPFDNFEFGPNVTMMDLSTGEIRSPFFERVFAVDAAEIKKIEEEKAAKRAELEAKRILEMANEVAKFVKDNACYAYNKLSIEEQLKNTEAASNYLLARQSDLQEFISKLEKGEINFVTIHRGDGCVTYTPIFAYNKDEVFCANMTCALARILALYW